MFGSDENARPGYDDPRQAVETCGMVEQITSDALLLGITGDPFWAENAEDVAFNSLPAAFMPDYKALRYLTAPNMVISDRKNHHPGIDNKGPFLMMNPFSSRCCQHNHAAGWVYYAEHSWAATPDNGLAAQLYSAGEVTATVGEGTPVKLTETTRYPFEEAVSFTVNTPKKVGFPLYLRIPAWCKAPLVTVNGKSVALAGRPGGYVRLSRTWQDNDRVVLRLPMELRVRQWEKNKNSVSVNYGPLTFSLQIAERYVPLDSKETAIHDSRWQEQADPRKWPSYEIHPASDWNYGLLLDGSHPEQSFRVVRGSWPADDNPFTNATAPIRLAARGKQIPAWQVDAHGLCGVLPGSPVTTGEPVRALTLVPMGGARLRISAFPVVK